MPLAPPGPSPVIHMHRDSWRFDQQSLCTVIRNYSDQKNRELLPSHAVYCHVEHKGDRMITLAEAL